MDDSIGFYQPLKQDSVTIEIKYISFNESHDEKAVKGFFIEREYGVKLYVTVYCIIGIKHGFSCIKVCKVPRKLLKTEANG